jgi:hypothetical protein
MKMPEEDTKTKITFKIAGKTATLQFADWNTAPWVSAIGTVMIGEKDFNAGGINAMLKDDAKQRNKLIARLNNDGGIPTPLVEVGDVADPGLGGVGDLEDLVSAVGLDPGDPTDYDEVELSVRCASLMLARKIAKKSGLKKP